MAEANHPFSLSICKIRLFLSSTVLSLVCSTLLRGKSASLSQKDLSESHSPESLLGTALETLNFNLKSASVGAFSNQLSLSNDVHVLIATTQAAASVILRDKVREKGRRLEEIEREVKELEVELYSTETECGGKRGCSECTASANCVWCEAESRCTVGSAEGPLGGVCALFRYKRCPKPECRDGLTCSACLVLGCTWCANGNQCFEQISEAEFCHESMKVLTVNQCGETEAARGSDGGRYVQPEIRVYPEDVKPSNKYRRIVNLKETAEYLKGDIRSLEIDIRKLTGSVTPAIITQPKMEDLGDLSSVVEASANDEFDKVVDQRENAVEEVKAEIRRKRNSQKYVKTTASTDVESSQFV